MIISDVVIEHAPNPYFDEPCPSCGDPFDVARDCLIGVALHGRAREVPRAGLCSHRLLATEQQIQPLPTSPKPTRRNPP